MLPQPVYPVTVLYDGACRVCHAEMAHYRRRALPGRLEFVDISAPEFEAARYGLNEAALQARMHVRDASGRLYLGVAAFPVIWLALPGRRYRWLACFIGWPGVRQLAALGYRLFARYRHLLPRTERGCDESTCSPDKGR